MRLPEVKQNLPLKGNTKQRGVALVIVLWMLVLMTVIAAAITATQRTEVSLAKAQVSVAESRALVGAGINYAISQLLEKNDRKEWIESGEAEIWRFNDRDIIMQVAKEADHININMARPSLLKGLFGVVGLDVSMQDALAGAIIDWRDKDDLRQLHGAEDDDYDLAGLKYGAKDQPFDDISELLLIKGMNKKIFDAIRPAITTHGGRAELMNSVVPLVREALSFLGKDISVKSSGSPNTFHHFVTRAGNNYRIKCKVNIGDDRYYSEEVLVDLTLGRHTGYKIVHLNVL